MTQQDVERMISLADDKYIEEAFEQKIPTKKRFPAVLPFAAAAAVVCGLFFAARHHETSINDMVATEVTDITTVTELDEYNENLRYWKYFDGNKSEAIIQPERTDYYSVNLPDEYIKEIINLNSDREPLESSLHFDRDDNIIYFSTNLTHRFSSEFSNAYLQVYPIYDKQPIFPENANPEIINGVEVYGYEINNIFDSTAEERRTEFMADFVIGNCGYSLMFLGVGYKEAYEITEMLIERKLTIDEFYSTEYFKRSGMTLGQLWNIEPFGKFVPRKRQFGDMTLMEGDTNGLTDYVETKVDDEIVRKTLYMWYSDMLGENTGKEILFKFQSYNYEFRYCNAADTPVYIFDLVRSMMKNYAAEDKPADEINSFDFRIDCGECIIDVKATCTEEELWECLTSIMREATTQMTSSFMLYLTVPVEGEISAPYGHLQSNFHKGIDFRADEGTPVYAAADGVVIVPVDVDTGDEKNVTINHYTDINTFYSHLSKVVVKEGDEVKQGDLIGYVGSTGESTEPHLHFELCIDGEYVDPIDYFSDQAKADIAMQNELGMHELLESEFSQIHLPNQPTQN